MSNNLCLILEPNKNIFTACWYKEQNKTGRFFHNLALFVMLHGVCGGREPGQFAHTLPYHWSEKRRFQCWLVF